VREEEMKRGAQEDKRRRSRSREELGKIHGRGEESYFWWCCKLRGTDSPKYMSGVCTAL
jgi:hypothetical protein